MMNKTSINSSSTGRGRVAVLGLGVSGITAVKNLLEHGFDVVGYERNKEVGGLWVWKDDPAQTTVLKSTRSNGSKQFMPYTDFPLPDEYPDYPSAAEVATYIQSYAVHFNLLKYCQFNTTIKLVSPCPSGGWSVKLSQGSGGEVKEEIFDRVMVTTGPFGKSWMPSKPGMKEFKGEIMHSQEYKRPELFKGKKVVVVGIANTGCDIATELAGVADKVYVSHRYGGRILKRYPKGKPLDHKVTRRLFHLGAYINSAFPRLAAYLSTKAIDSQVRSFWPEMKPEWRLLPAAPIVHARGAMNETIIPKMASGEIVNLGGIDLFTQTGIVTKEEGEVECDVVIFCTGMHFDYSFLSPEADPTNHPTPEWDNHPNAQNLPFPRLYQTLFPPGHADTLAFIGPCRGFSFAAMANSDMAAQAIATIWTGLYTLPSKAELDKWCDENYKFGLNQLKTYRIPKTGTFPVAFENWLCEVVGNRVEEKLGYGLEGWKFWLTERKLCNLLMDGVNTPFKYRLWPARSGGRKVWEGAREAIWRTNGIAPPP